MPEPEVFVEASRRRRKCGPFCAFSKLEQIDYNIISSGPIWLSECSVVC
jgi:hypothetical protein